ncbi:hypothetical protein CPB84DRAFT_1786055 [Gymnopilus junonius]|uniref:Uncharacterized protein n=1 Tax=Gymnopilus junonius TaxID=109634 RepID=A0A9P5TKF3_GYMJU|nr:hypothetical protein CPB84DRAFT_1786055 [Gymnopilus junonius]
MAFQDDSSPVSLDVFRPQSPEPYHTFSRPPDLNGLGTKGQRILWLESKMAWGIYGTGEFYTLQNVAWEKREEEWTKKIKEIVKEDTEKPDAERIDSVAWLVEFSSEPTAEMWQALDGLSPKHLHMLAGFAEESAIAPLGALKHQWTRLETLTLSNETNDEFLKGAPKVLSRITSLSLQYCFTRWNLVPPHATRLKDLHIVKNNACQMFCYAVDNKRNPGLAEQLEVLEIKTKSGFDPQGSYTSRGFRRCLKKCTNLRELTYAAGVNYGMDVQLTEYIPDSVEKLTLEFSRSLPFLREFYAWIESAADSTWLPRLKAFKMSIDPKSRLMDTRRVRNSPRIRMVVNSPLDFTAERFDLEFDEMRRQVYDFLNSRQPAVECLL